MKSIKEVNDAITGAYLEIMTWKKNTFDVPRGKVGNDFIAEVSRLLRLSIKRQDWNP